MPGIRNADPSLFEPGFEWDPNSQKPEDREGLLDPEALKEFYRKQFEEWKREGMDFAEESWNWALANGAWFIPGAAYERAIGLLLKAGAQIVRNGAKIFAILRDGKKIELLVEESASIWSKNWAERGRAAEDVLGRNLSRNFETIDKFENGVATSIKSIDLTAKTYQDSGALVSKLNQYVSEVAAFKGSKGGGTTRITSNMIQGRELSLAIPPNATAAQMSAIGQVTQAAASQGVTVTVHVIP